MRYDFLKGKNNFQCGINISHHKEKKQIDLHLFFLNMPKAEYGIGLYNESEKKNLFIIDNTKSNKFKLSFDAEKLREFNHVIIYNIEKYDEILFLYNVEFLGLFKKEKNTETAKTASKQTEKAEESRAECAKESKTEEETQKDIHINAQKTNEIKNEAKKEETQSGQFQALMPEWSKISNEIEEKLSKNVNENTDEEKEDTIIYKDKKIEDTTTDDQKTKRYQPFIQNENKSDLEKIEEQNKKVQQLNKKYIQSAKKQSEPAGYKITKEILNEYFRPISPFEPKIKNHEWFVSVDNSKKFLVELNEHMIDYQTLYFNTGAFKQEGYPSRIVGYYSKDPNNENIEYVVLGVLGKYMQSHQPMRGLTGYVYWHSVTKDAEIGYWVIYLELNSGKIVVPMNKKK